DARGLFGATDPLHAVRALLHHAARADRDARVVLERAAVVVLVAEPVEPPHLVRAVVRAEPRADAAVVDHLVEPVGRVHRRADRTHVLARRVLAVLAQHRHVDARIDVAIDPDPRHVTAARTVGGADDRHVVL